MKKYEVEFSWTVTQTEKCRTWVEASSEEKAKELVESGEYDEVEPYDVEVEDYKDFEIISINEI